MRILIIGLDGATWDVIDEHLLSNYMPNLAKLRVEGAYGVLRSTDPPITPAAWTTFNTGCQPSTHRVVGFRDYSFKDERLSISSAKSCAVPTIWQELSRQGFKVASINVPWTYPCVEVNGILVAGYGLPSTQAEFTYPADFRKELLHKIPDYDVAAQWDDSGNQDRAGFDANVSRVERSFQQRLEAARLVNDKIAADVMMVQFQDLDMMQHRIWPYLDVKTRDSFAFYRDRLFAMFQRLDQSIGALLELTQTDDTVVMVVSDHGFGRMLGSIKANLLLHGWGYLRFKSPWRRLIRRLRRNVRSMTSEKGTSMAVELKSPVDWKRSRAMVMYAAMNGHIYLNVKGRNPQGRVHRGPEYDYAIKDLRARFAKLTDPLTSESLFSRIVTPAELYNVRPEDGEKLGDLILIPRPGYIVHQSTARNGTCIELQPGQSLSGCHYYEGLYVLCGKNIRRNWTNKASIVDVAPTIYAMLGAETPAYLDGRAMEAVFESKVAIKYQDGPDQLNQEKCGPGALSSKEEEEVARQLSALGYLD